MDKLIITGKKDAFKIILDGQKFIVPKDHSSLMWAKIVYPKIERSQTLQTKLQLLMKEQYFLSLDQSERIDKVMNDLSKVEHNEITTELKNILELNMRWQFLIHEIYQLYKFDLPTSYF